MFKEKGAGLIKKKEKKKEKGAGKLFLGIKKIPLKHQRQPLHAQPI